MLRRHGRAGVQNPYYPEARPARHHGHMTHYGDYCPIAVGVEVLGDRWTPLVIRELMVGASGFNEIHRGIPGSAGPCSRSGSGCSNAAGWSAVSPGPLAGQDVTR
jgi:hypothetical protein